MKRSKYFVLFLLVMVITLFSFVTVFAVTKSSSSGGYCDCGNENKIYVTDSSQCSEACASISSDSSSQSSSGGTEQKSDSCPSSCCEHPEPESEGWQKSCGGCKCGGGSSSTSSEEPKVFIRPEDSKGRQYYIDENGVQRNVRYKTWADCMTDFGNADTCKTLVTDECESCLGVCQTAQAKGTTFSSGSCYSVCRTSCDGRGTGAAYTGKDSSGTDEYGSWYLEGGVKKYSNFNDFRSCWSVMGDAKECIKYGYYCGYKNGFYVSYLCSWDDDACRERVMDEYAAACK